MNDSTKTIKYNHDFILLKNELNTVIIEADMSDKTVIIGKGAGKKPTASAVVSDILYINKPKY